MIANVNETRKEFEIFNYKNLGSVRTYLDENGEPWFCLKDVCDVLGIVNITTLKERLSEDGLGLTEVIDSIGRKQEVYFINEGNLYRAIGRSRKKEANNFMNWVFDEILPSLRKAGQQKRFANNSYSELNDRITTIENTLGSVTEFMSSKKLDTAYKYSATFSLSGKGRENFINYLKEKGIIDELLIPIKPYRLNGTFIIEEYNVDDMTGIPGLSKIKFLSTITDYGLEYFKDELIKDGYRKENIDLDLGGSGIESEWCKYRTEK